MGSGFQLFSFPTEKVDCHLEASEILDSTVPVVQELFSLFF